MFSGQALARECVWARGASLQLCQTATWHVRNTHHGVVNGVVSACCDIHVRALPPPSSACAVDADGQISVLNGDKKMISAVPAATGAIVLYGVLCLWSLCV
jgi:hypothetical protein